MSFTRGFFKVANDLLPGGLADNMPDSAFDPKEIKKGMEIEREHTKNKALQKEITKDHLMEDEKYPTHLKKMEKEYKS